MPEWFGTETGVQAQEAADRAQAGWATVDWSTYDQKALDALRVNLEKLDHFARRAILRHVRKATGQTIVFSKGVKQPGTYSSTKKGKLLSSILEGNYQGIGGGGGRPGVRGGGGNNAEVKKAPVKKAPGGRAARSSSRQTRRSKRAGPSC